LKLQRIGRYSTYEGFKCKICGRVVKNIVKHVSVVHKQGSPNAAQHLAIPTSSENSIEGFISAYETILATSGVGKREKVSEKTARSYGNQITTLWKTIDDLFYPERFYNRLQSTVKKTGAEATKYVYLATLQNFLTYMELYNPSFNPKQIVILQKIVNNWLQRQRKKKEKRSNHFKEISRKKLDGLKFPYHAINDYEKRHQHEIPLKRCMETFLFELFVRSGVAHVF